MSNIKPEIRSLADSLKEGMKFEDGIFKLDDNTYEKTLPEGLTMDMVEKHQDHTTDLVAALGLALGERSNEVFKEDKRLEETSVEITAGKDIIGGVYQRSREVRAGISADSGKTVKYGILSMKVGVNAHANKGSLKKVRNHLSEEAKKILGGHSIA